MGSGSSWSGGLRLRGFPYAIFEDVGDRRGSGSVSTNVVQTILMLAA